MGNEWTDLGQNTITTDPQNGTIEIKLNVKEWQDRAIQQNNQRIVREIMQLRAIDEAFDSDGFLRGIRANPVLLKRKDVLAIIKGEEGK